VNCSISCIIEAGAAPDPDPYILMLAGLDQSAPPTLEPNFLSVRVNSPALPQLVTFPASPFLVNSDPCVFVLTTGTQMFAFHDSVFIIHFFSIFFLTGLFLSLVPVDVLFSRKI
jgi:hypothetical protein